jgi:transcription-repair coupling factor (superfamily II helicase)
MLFPTWECLPYDVFSPHEDIISERLRLLALLPGLERGIVLTHSDNLAQRLPPRDYVQGHSFSLKQNQKVDMDLLRSRLVDSNYVSVNQVITPGEFTVRGGLIDIYPMGTDRPFRLDLFDDELESIRIFDPETQRSLETVAYIDILPAREFPMTEAGVKMFRSAFRRQFEGDPRKQLVYEEVSRGNTPAGTEFFFPLFFEDTATFFDYLPENSMLVCTGELESYLATYNAEISDRYENSNYDIQRRVLPPDTLYLTPERVLDYRNSYTRIKIIQQPTARADWMASSKPNRQFPVDARKERPYEELINHISNTDGRILIVVDTPGRREAMEGILAGNQLRPQSMDSFSAFLDNPDCRLAITTAPLDRGFNSASHNIEIICESQLYGEKVHQRRRRSRESRDPDSIIKSLAELHIGDPVVHIEHGVGRYKGLKQIDILGEETEYLTLEYENNDRLYIPVLSLNLISRFVGGSPELAPLHRLGGDQWGKSKKRAREKAYDVAAELLEIEALRNAREGTAFSTDQPDYEKFISQFPFEETPDQLQSIGEVLQDLQSSSPMDRLVCGDVGFGKTEVALRAAFVVSNNYRQVAILAPTTLLAHQHYQTFLDRFSDWPINIAVLSRFNTKKQSAEIVEQITQGKIDIVIGTHRLLQEDIRFSNLGLLIIDEEHRFGVRQKEKMKRLRSQVDILTLTATPIPRTLNITMAGLRAMSIIATPPVNRMSIKTFVRETNRGLIREACLREIRRGGQVFYLHNDVRTIERTAADLSELVPEGEINIGHGQMRETQLERVMQDFYHQRFNILVCSTIIESGIDIPTANTIIIDRADRFGLAQLHQLRGRVGRSHHQAFAYLLIPGKNMITADAQKRLDAIESMEDLGAGFALASHDLEIRGAGELLGETQSGLIDDVGFSLYSEYLSMAVESIRQGKLPDLDTDRAHDRSTSVDLHVPALFPGDYLSNAHTRLVMYKRIASAASLDELEELQIETIDRFGLLPAQGKNLFRLTAIRLQAEQLDISKLDVSEKGGTIEFHDNPVIDVSVIFRLINENPSLYRLAGPSSVQFLPELEDVDQRISQINTFLDALQSTLE